MPTRTSNKGNDTRNAFVRNPSKGSIPKFEWNVKWKAIFNESRKTFLLEPSHKTILPKNDVSKQPKVEYDFCINENILIFCIFIKESWK